MKNEEHISRASALLSVIELRLAAPPSDSDDWSTIHAQARELMNATNKALCDALDREAKVTT